MMAMKRLEMWKNEDERARNMSKEKERIRERNTKKADGTYECGDDKDRIVLLGYGVNTSSFAGFT